MRIRNTLVRSLNGTILSVLLGACAHIESAPEPTRDFGCYDGTSWGGLTFTHRIAETRVPFTKTDTGYQIEEEKPHFVSEALITLPGCGDDHHHMYESWTTKGLGVQENEWVVYIFQYDAEKLKCVTKHDAVQTGN